MSKSDFESLFENGLDYHKDNKRRFHPNLGNKGVNWFIKAFHPIAEVNGSGYRKMIAKWIFYNFELPKKKNPWSIDKIYYQLKPFWDAPNNDKSFKTIYGFSLFPYYHELMKSAESKQLR
jgi:hypothetical protein